MFKILLALLLLTPSAWAQQWRGGTGESTIPGSSSAALIGYNSYNKIVQPLDNLLGTYCNEYLAYASSSTMTVVAGSCAVSNSQGSIRLFLMDTTNTTITSANLDTGSITASTTYYVYSTAATTSATSSTYYISASNTAPSGQTYYYKIGSFVTDSSSNFTAINNTNIGQEFITKTSKSNGVVYQALTDTFVTATNSIGGSGNVTILSDSTSTPSAVCNDAALNTGGGVVSASCMVRKGDYYEVTSTANNASVNALSTNH